MRKERTHLIYKLLHDTFGGEWKKHAVLQQWTSKDHDFYVYRGGRWDNKLKRSKMGYRRSDTKELFFECDGRKP